MRVTGGAVIIPAHNEERGIARTLATLAPAARSGLDVVVVPNGCTDRTEAVARSFPWATVVTLAEGSKQAALNAGDAVASAWPRAYLDADLVFSACTIPNLIRELAVGTHPSGRPEYRHDTSRCSAPVRAFFRARDRMPSMHRHLWGAGCYALTRSGRARFGAFPLDQADDAFVDSLFDGSEKLFVPGHPIVVQQPRTISALIHTLPRVYRGKIAGSDAADGSRLSELVRTVRGPASALDAAAYLGIALAGKMLARHSSGQGWQRDASSRVP